MTREERLFKKGREMFAKEVDIISFIKMIRKFETFYEALGHKFISDQVHAKSPYILLENTSEESVNDYKEKKPEPFVDDSKADDNPMLQSFSIASAMNI